MTAALGTAAPPLVKEAKAYPSTLQQAFSNASSERRSGNSRWNKFYLTLKHEASVTKNRPHAVRMGELALVLLY
jgi:hypothetical protein